MLTSAPRTEEVVSTTSKALRPLVASGELTTAQAEAVVRALAERQVGAAAQGAVSERSGWLARVGEIAAYLGAALLVSGMVSIVGQHWTDLGRSGQIWLLAVIAALLGMAGLAVTGFRGSRPSDDEAEVLRRLSSTLLVLSTAAVAGLLARVFVPAVGDFDQTRGGWMLITIAVVCGLLLVGVRLSAPSALDEVGLLGVVLAFTAGVLLVVGFTDQGDYVTAPILVVGLGWAFIATSTRALTVPTLGLTLGLAAALWASLVGDGDAANKLMTATLALVCFATYLVRPAWPWLAVALIAAVAFTLMVVSPVASPAVTLIVAGVVLLVLAATAFALQRRRVGPAR
jgi:hypothetical protein